MEPSCLSWAALKVNVNLLPASLSEAALLPGDTSMS